MALLGSTVDPRLFIQDYSGFVDAAKMQAQGMMGLGQSIEQGVEKYQEAKKERQKLDASRKSSITNIESAIKMGEAFGIPLQSSLQPVLDKLNDPNTTPYEAAMIGQSASDQIGNVLKLGMFQAELQSQSQRSQFAAAADIRKAQIEAEKEAGEFKVLDITTPDGGAVKARFYNDGRVTDIYGNPLPGSAGRAASIESAGLDADGLGPPPTDPYEGLALPQGEGEMPNDEVLPPKQGPDLWDSSGKVIAPSIAPQVPTGAAAGIEAAIPLVGPPRPQAAPGIEAASQAGVQASAPQAASPWANVPGYRPPESKKQWRPATPDENKLFGGGPGQVNVISGEYKLMHPPSGMIIEQTPDGFKLVQGAGVGSGAAKQAAAAEAQKEQSFERSRSIIGSAATIIPVIKEALSSNPLLARGQQTLGNVLPATVAGRIGSELETIRVNTSKDEIGRMRASSPTGSAGGTITEKEWPKFENRFGKMETGMHPVDLVANVQKTALNQFESVNGTPEEVITLFNNGKISKPMFDEYIQEYKNTRNILGIPDEGVGGLGNDWTKYEPGLLRYDHEKQVEILTPEAAARQKRLEEIRKGVAQ